MNGLPIKLKIMRVDTFVVYFMCEISTNRIELDYHPILIYNLEYANKTQTLAI